MSARIGLSSLATRTRRLPWKGSWHNLNCLRHRRPAFAVADGSAEVVAAALAIAARRPRGVVTTITMAVGAMLIGVATVLGLLHAPWFLLVAPAAFAATLMAAIVTVAHDAHTRLRTRGVNPTTERKLVAFAVACGGRVTVTGVAHALQIPMAAADAALCALASSAYVDGQERREQRRRGLRVPGRRRGPRPERARAMNGPAGASSMVVYQAPPIGLVRVAYRRRGAAALLALLLGSVGAHKFYTGRPVLGVIYFMAFWTGIPLLLGVLEAARYLMMSRQAFDLEYNARLL